MGRPDARGRMRRIMRRFGGVLLGALATAALLVPSASAKTGVGVDVGNIDVAEKLVPGRTYALPSITVTNIGDTTDTPYSLGVSYSKGQKELRLGGDWISFDPAVFRLDPGETATVQPVLVIPAGAEPGDYAALLSAQAVSAEGGTGYTAAAATKLTFEVVEIPWSAALTLWARQRAPWSYLSLAGLILILAGAALGRSRKRA